MANILNMSYLMFTLVFTTVTGMLLQLGGYATFALINPIMFSAGFALIGVAIGAIGTEVTVVGTTVSARGIAVVALFSWVIAYLLNMTVHSSVWQYVYAIILVPNIIAIGLLFMSMAQK